MYAALNLARIYVAAAAIIQWRRQRGERIRWWIERRKSLKKEINKWCSNHRPERNGWINISFYLFFELFAFWRRESRMQDEAVFIYLFIYLDIKYYMLRKFFFL